MTYLFRHLTPKSLLYRWLLYWRWIPRTVLLALSAATTAIGVGSGVAVEVNPLVTSPAAFAGLMLARVVGTELVDKMDEPQRTEILTTLNSVWWGVSVSNILILLTASNPVGFVTGAMVALGWWVSTDEQRRFAEICAAERAINPRLKCIYSTTPGLPG